MDIRINGSGEEAVLELPAYSVGQNKTHVSVRQISTYSLIDYNGIYGTEIVLKSGQRVRAGCYPDDLSRAITASSHATNTRTNEVLRLTRERDDALAEVERLRKCCTQRGARMQIMRDWMREFPAYSQRYATMWDQFAARKDALPWFDEDGVPK